MPPRVNEITTRCSIDMQRKFPWLINASLFRKPHIFRSQSIQFTVFTCVHCCYLMSSFHQELREVQWPQTEQLVGGASYRAPLGDSQRQDRLVVQLKNAQQVACMIAHLGRWERGRCTHTILTTDNKILEIFSLNISFVNYDNTE